MDDPNAPLPGAGAAVVGVRLGPVSGSGASLESIGFLGGRSPFAGETTGAFGQAAERGVIGIATTASGIGVYGGSLGGVATAVQAESVSNNAILAKSESGNGIQADSVSGFGVAGTTNSATQSAVFGFNGAKGQVPPEFPRPAGNGVWGHTTVENGAGVAGSVEPGLRNALAGRFFGDVEVLGTLYARMYKLVINDRRHRIFEIGASIDDLPDGILTANSVIMVSLTAVDSDGNPHMGPTTPTMKVYNVTPGNRSVKIRGEIDSGEDVDFRATIFIANPPELP